MSFAGSCGSLANAATAHGSWTLKRQGFIAPHVTVRDAGSDVTKGVFEPSWAGGGEFLYGGARYRFSGHGWFHPAWTVSENGRQLLHTESGDRETLVHIDSQTLLAPDVLSLLLVLAVYVPVLADEDAATTAVLAAAIC